MKKKLLLFLALLPLLASGQYVINLDPSSLGSLNYLLDSVQNWIWVSSDNTTGIETGTYIYPYTTIADGLAASVAGTMVIVVTPQDGSAYAITDALVIPYNNIVLTGQGGSTIIDGDGLATGEHAISITGKTGCAIMNMSIQTEDGGGKTSHCIFLDNGANTTLIQNVTILDSDDDGIHIEGTNTTDITIKDCNILDVDGDGIFVDMDASNTMTRMNILGNTVQSAGGVGISIRDYQYGNCNDNTVSGSTSHGVLLALGVYNTINDNVITGNGAEGIQLNGSTDNTVSGNTATGNTNVGIEFTGASHRNTASGNTCRTNQYGIYFESSDYCTASDNVTEGNSASGIFVDDSPYASVTGNVSTNDDSGEGGGGIVVMGCSHVTVTGNTASASTYNGIYLYAASYCTVTGNVFSGNTLDGIYLSDACTYNILSSNECYGNTGDGIELAAAAEVGNIVTLNKLLGNGEDALEDNGAGTMLMHDNTAGTWDFSTARLTTAVTDADGGSNGLFVNNTFTKVGVIAHKAIQSDLIYTPASAGTACPIAVVGKVSLNGDLTAANSYPGLGWGVQGQIHMVTGSTIDGSTFGSPGAVYAGLRGVVTDAGTSTYTKGNLAGLYSEIQMGQANANDGANFNIYGAWIRNQGVATSTDMAAGLFINANPAFPNTILKGIDIEDNSTVTGIDIGITSSGTAFNAVNDIVTTADVYGDSADFDAVIIADLATANTTVLSPTSTGQVDTLETTDLATAAVTVTGLWTFDNIVIDSADIDTADIDYAVIDYVSIDNAVIDSAEIDTLDVNYIGVNSMLTVADTITITGAGTLGLHETTTPTALADYGKIYTKSDNELYFQDGGGTEHVVDLSASDYGEMGNVYGSSATEVLHSANEWHAMFHANITGSVPHLNSGFSFVAGKEGSGTTTTAGGGDSINIADAAHGLLDGDIVTVQSDSHDDTMAVVNVIDAGNFRIKLVYAADEAITWQMGSYLLVGTTGVYRGMWKTAFSQSLNNTQTTAMTPFVNLVMSTKATGIRLLTNNTDSGSMVGNGIMSFTAGDRIWFAAQTTAAQTLTHLVYNVSIH